MRSRTFVGFLLPFMIASAQASQQFCVEPQWARRAGTLSCWVSLEEGQGRSLCLSRKEWVSRLERSDVPWGCGEWRGKWRSFESRRNEPGIRDPIPPTLRYDVEAGPRSGVPVGVESFRWRVERLRERVSAWLEPFDPQGLMRSILIAQSPARDSSQLWRLLGFVHLLTASGIHLYLLGLWIRRAVLQGAESAGLRASQGQFCAWISASVASAAVWLLAGARLGMLRPFLIVSLRSVSRHWGWRWASWAPLVLSMGADLIWAGFRAWRGLSGGSGAGRIHYGLAVGGGLLALESLRTRSRHRPSAWREHFAIAVGSWCFGVPWELWENGGVALATPLLSFMTLPAVLGGLYPALLAGTAGIALGLDPAGWSGMNWALSGFGAALESFGPAIARLETWWYLPWGAYCFAAGAAALLAGRRIRPRVWLLILGVRLLGEVGLAHSSIASAQIASAQSVEQLDVAQGDAALVRSADGRSAGLIDAGSRLALGPGDWVKLFAQRGITGLKFVALSHLDEDHAGGVVRLAAVIPIDCVQSARAQWDSPRGRILERTLRSRGVRVVDHETGCFPYRVFGPAAGGADSSKSNGAMSAFWIPLAAGGGYFAMGDADAKDELAFERRVEPELLHPLILKVSHHGSRTSTPEELLRKLRPQRAWVSCGVGNHFGHPTARVIELLERLRIPIERTDREGSLDSRFRHSQVKPSQSGNRSDE